jgi:hypothetical protein
MSNTEPKVGIHAHATWKSSRRLAILSTGILSAYHKPSARDARQRILAFFDRHLQFTGSAGTADTGL